VWTTSPVPSTCTRCSRGCAIEVSAYRGRVVRVRPRYDAQVNKSWICDHGRFAFDDWNLPGRLATALEAGPEGLCDVGLEAGARRAAEWLREAGPRALLLASPYLTLEEGAALQELARALGATAHFLAPPEGPGDGILRTGDPAPNRRGLADLGLAPLPPGEARARLAAAPAALLAGEKVLHLLHGLQPADAEAVPPPTASGARGMVLDTHPREGFALCLPARTAAEKSGRVRNLQGLDRILRPALSPPPGVPDGAELLARIAAAVPAAARGRVREGAQV
jgi:NADH dehydrogenase/NADH:ubiquinone oxidoreductase subunit G